MKRYPVRTRPKRKLPGAPQEMQQWSELLLQELLGWPQTTTRPMFGMTAIYRGKAIFGVLPKTRAMDSPYSVSFKVPRRTPAVNSLLSTDLRILLPESDTARWISFELQSGENLSDAIQWFARAYEWAGKK